MLLPHVGFRIVVTLALVLALGGLIMGVITMLNLVYTSSLLLGVGATLDGLSLVILSVALLLRGG